MTDTERTLTLAVSDLNRLLSAHDGDMALLYLHALRAGGFDAESAATTLCRTLQEVEAAAEKLRRMGLLPGAQPEPARILPPADELPSYTSADLVRFSQEDPQLQGIFAEAENIYGRKLSSPEMSKLAGIYKHLGMSGETVALLLHYCSERAAERRPGSVPSPLSVEKEAFDWARREILTHEQAEDYIRFRREQREKTAQVKETLNIRGRELSKTEREYVERWLEMGFGPEAVAIAYDRTLVKIGRLHWSYMNKIIESWHAKKLHSPAEIESGDGRRAASGDRGPATEADYNFDSKL